MTVWPVEGYLEIPGGPSGDCPGHPCLRVSEMTLVSLVVLSAPLGVPGGDYSGHQCALMDDVPPVVAFDAPQTPLAPFGAPAGCPTCYTVLNNCLVFLLVLSTSMGNLTIQ